MSRLVDERLKEHAVGFRDGAEAVHSEIKELINRLKRVEAVCDIMSLRNGVVMLEHVGQATAYGNCIKYLEALLE